MLVLTAIVASIWVALLVAAPALPPHAAAALYAVGSQICHQRPERSFHLDGAQLPVCARCTGIYVGAAIGAWLATSPRSRRRSPTMSPRTILVYGAVPTAITILAEWGAVWAVSNAARAAAGVPLGGAVALVVADAVATLHYVGCAPRRPIASSRPPTRT